MKKVLGTIIAGSFILLSGSVAAADAKEACVSLVKKAGEFMSANGKDKLIAEINSQKGAFANGETYLFASAYVPNWNADKDRTVTLAHGANPKLVGKDMTDLKDADGVYFVRKMGEVAMSPAGEGWTTYKWPHPVTKELERKTTFTKHVGELVISCGVYK